MTHYELSIQNPNQQYIQFKVTISDCQENQIFHLSKWRPGRYELGNFAKNVKGLKIFNSENKIVSFEKIDSSTWKINCAKGETVHIEYAYFSTELNAGSTFLSKEMLYVNPVNCFIYTPQDLTQSSTFKLNIPEKWSVAGSLPEEEGVYFADNFHELADSPFICTEKIQHNTYEAGETLFHLWFAGECQIDWERILSDFKAFTAIQLEKLNEFPVKEYHFLFHILPYRAYHGVEHQKSTVITLGPSYDLFKNTYADLLGVSSHELYHTWNVKAIRPIEMHPYNYQSENYSRLGYLCEGVTTYMGDLMLFKSAVFDFEDYKREFSAQLQKHFDNPGRFNFSVADSSFDTWLDGYVPGAPGRKVSIYTEGCLLAFVSDVFIRRHTKNEHGLDELMKRLYFDYALQNKGVSEEDYCKLLVELGGEELEKIIPTHFYGSAPYESILTEALDYLGLEMITKPSRFYSFAKLGFKSVPFENGFAVKALFTGGPADLAGVQLEDKIIAVNGFLVKNDLEQWLEYFQNDLKTLTIERAGRILGIDLPEMQGNYYMEYGIRKVENPNSFQKEAFEIWSN
jgi:predicted metalloprotease with PDZ domain